MKNLLLQSLTALFCFQMSVNPISSGVYHWHLEWEASLQAIHCQTCKRKWLNMHVQEVCGEHFRRDDVKIRDFVLRNQPSFKECQLRHAGRLHAFTTTSGMMPSLLCITL
ncbi:hypothetical protein MTO96_034484 [Rhipicephalus appendiculatus]